MREEKGNMRWKKKLTHKKSGRKKGESRLHTPNTTTIGRGLTRPGQFSKEGAQSFFFYRKIRAKKVTEAVSAEGGWESTLLRKPLG